MKRKLLFGITILTAGSACIVDGMDPTNSQEYKGSYNYTLFQNTYPLPPSQPSYGNPHPSYSLTTSQHTPPPYFPSDRPVPLVPVPLDRHVSPPVSVPYSQYTSFHQSQSSYDSTYSYQSNATLPSASAYTMMSYPYSSHQPQIQRPFTRQPLTHQPPSFIPAPIRNAAQPVPTSTATDQSLNSSQEPVQFTKLANEGHDFSKSLPFVPESKRLQQQISTDTEATVPFSLVTAAPVVSSNVMISPKKSPTTFSTNTLHSQSLTNKEISPVQRLGLSFGILSPFSEPLPFLPSTPMTSPIQHGTSPKVLDHAQSLDISEETKLFPPVSPRADQPLGLSTPPSFFSSSHLSYSNHIISLTSPFSEDRHKISDQLNSSLNKNAPKSSKRRHRPHGRTMISSSSTNTTTTLFPFQVPASSLSTITEELKTQNGMDTSKTQATFPVISTSTKSSSRHHHHHHTATLKKVSPLPTIDGARSTPPTTGTLSVTSNKTTPKKKKISKFRTRLQEQAEEIAKYKTQHQEQEEEIARLQMYSEEMEQKQRIAIEKLKTQQQEQIQEKARLEERLEESEKQRISAERLRQEDIEKQKRQQESLKKIQTEKARLEERLKESEKLRQGDIEKQKQQQQFLKELQEEKEELLRNFQDTIAENERLKGKLSVKQEVTPRTEPTSKLEKLRKELEKSRQELIQEQREHSLTKTELKTAQSIEQEQKTQSEKRKKDLDDLQQKFIVQNQELKKLKENQQKEKQKQREIETLRSENKKLHHENENLKKQLSDTASKTHSHLDQVTDFEDLRRILDQDQAPQNLTKALSTEPKSKPGTTLHLPDQTAEIKKLHEQLTELKKQNQALIASNQAKDKKEQESRKQMEAILRLRLETMNKYDRLLKEKEETDAKMGIISSQILEYMHQQTDSSSSSDMPTPPPPSTPRHPMQHDKIFPIQEGVANIARIAIEEDRAQTLPITYTGSKSGEDETRDITIMPKEHFERLQQIQTQNLCEIRDLKAEIFRLTSHDTSKKVGRKQGKPTPTFIAQDLYEAYGKWFFNVAACCQDASLPQRLPVTFPPEHLKYGNQTLIFSLMPQSYLDTMWNAITQYQKKIKDLEIQLGTSMTTSMKTLPGSQITFHISSDETSGDTKISVSSSKSSISSKPSDLPSLPPLPPPSSGTVSHSSLFPSVTSAFSTESIPNPLISTTQTSKSSDFSINSIIPSAKTPILPLDDGGEQELKKMKENKK